MTPGEKISLLVHFFTFAIITYEVFANEIFCVLIFLEEPTFLNEFASCHKSDILITISWIKDMILKRFMN